MGRKPLTKEENIIKAQKIHGNFYNYEKMSEHTVSSSTVTVTCPIHGDFQVLWGSHINKKARIGCPECSREKKGLTRNQLIERANKKHNNEYDYSNLPQNVKSLDVVTIVCPNHGEFRQVLLNHIRGNRCPKCARQRKSYQDYIDQASQLHKQRFDYSKVPNDVRRSSKVTIICPDHGEFQQSWNNHLNGQQCPKCKQKRIQQTISKKFGVDNIGLIPTLPHIQQKRQLTSLQKYGVTHFNQLKINKRVRELLTNVTWLKQKHHTERCSATAIAKELQVDVGTVLRYMKEAGIELIHTQQSSGEQEIVQWLKTLVNVVKTNQRDIIPPLELDIFLPEYNLAIEYNGLFWHSDYQKKMISSYHLKKTQLCEQKGIRLIHIFEDEWRDQQQKCKDTLRHLLGKSPPGTFARNTYIKEIPWKQAQDFLNKHHLLGAGSSGNYRIGAFNKQTNELIGVMVFGKSTSERSNEIELKRFVTNKRNNPGLGSKMFKFAVNKQGYQEVIAFVDRRWFTGLVKDHIGFQRIYETKPAVWWTDGINRYHRRFISKQQAINALVEKDSTLSKHQAMKRLGLYRIWDCGKIKLKWKK